VILQPPSAKQAASIRLAKARINIWHGSVSSGKTTASLLKWADVVEGFNGNGALLMTGKTERTLKRNIILPLAELLGGDAVLLKEGSGEVRIFGRTVFLVGANDERAEQKIRGLTVGKAYGDEVTLWPESFFKMLLSRLRVPGAQFFGTTNPDGPFHYLKSEFIDRSGELDLEEFHFVLEDNPDLPPEYVSALKKEYTGLWYKRYIDGLWVLAEGVIWDAFDPEKHRNLDAVPEEVEIVRYILGVDYGTSNPFVAVLLAVDSQGRIWVLDEYRWDSAREGRQKTDAEYSEALDYWLTDHWFRGSIIPSAVYVDPSAASFILQLRKDRPWLVIEADNDVDDGLRSVSNLLAAGGLLGLEEKASGLWNEVASYAWDPKAAARGEDKPIKKHDHGPDALRYAVFTFKSNDPGPLEQYGWVG
jgi:PBSX family phage terminase large subunit